MGGEPDPSFLDHIIEFKKKNQLSLEKKTLKCVFQLKISS